jgi:drug/metabolite transporter (DMT)-like permease
MANSPGNQLLRGFVIAFTGALLFSTKAIIVKLAFRSNPADALTLLALRMLFAVPFYLAAAIWNILQKDQAKMNGRQWLAVVLLGLLGFYVSALFDFIGLKYISAGLERLILFLYPSFTVLINAMFFRQKILPVQRWALVLTYAGIGIAYFGELKVDVGNPHFYLGSLLIFICTITYSSYLVGMGRMVPQLGASRFTTYSTLAAATGVLAHYFVRELFSGQSHSLVGHGSGNVWIYGLALALIATVIPSFMLSLSTKLIGTNNLAIVSSIGPVSTILQAHFILGDPIFPAQIVGTVLVIAGILMIGRQTSRATMAMSGS